MLGPKTFPRGGVHPEQKKLTAQCELEICPLPEKVIIPIQQHIGAQSEILVKKGDEVKVGTLLAQSSAFISANIHSSVSGVVSKIDNFIDRSGKKKSAIEIKVVDDIYEDSIDLNTPVQFGKQFSASEIIERIKQAGIVGLGGATFPSFVKLLVPEGKKVDVLVANGAECEPYLTSDQLLMSSKAKQIIEAISILLKAFNIPKGIVGIENNKQEAIKIMDEVAAEYCAIEIQPLKVKYPQGAEKQLLKSCINKEIPSGGGPIDVGVVVLNVGTLYAIYEALYFNKPLFERIVTITGDYVKQPKNLLVRIGTPVRSLIDVAGGLPENTVKVIDGGPMMGKCLSNLDVPVTKGSSGIFLQDAFSHREKESPCMRCAKCVSVCAMGLEPYLLGILGRKFMFEQANELHALDCCECGSCQYICPCHIPLLDYIRISKGEITKKREQEKQNG